MIISFIEDDDKACSALISLHSIFFHRFKPRYYEHLTLDASSKSCKRVIAIRRGPRARHVLTVTYSLDCGEHSHLPVSPEALEVLENLHRFPELTQAKIILRYALWFRFKKEEEKEIMHSAMQASIDAISASRGAFSGLHLEIEPLPHTWAYDIFDNWPWRELQRGLKRFALVIGTSSPQDRPSEPMPLGLRPTDPDHQDFVLRIPHIFLKYMPVLEDLQITGRIYEFSAPSSSWKEAPQLYRLKSITLENFNLTESVVDTLIKSSKLQLSKIDLRRCIASSDTWRHLFEKLYKDRHTRTPGSLLITPMFIREAPRAPEQWNKNQKEHLNYMRFSNEMTLADARAVLLNGGLWPLNGTPLFDGPELTGLSADALRSGEEDTWEKWVGFLGRMESDRLAL